MNVKYRHCRFYSLQRAILNRRDGLDAGMFTNPLQQFDTRWRSTAVNTGLVRGNGTGATQMSVARQDRIWVRQKAFPHGSRP